MLNFTYYNPVKIVFGKGSIEELPNLIPAEAKVMMIYGGGSIKQNGVYDQVAEGHGGPADGRVRRHRAESALRNLHEVRRVDPKTRASISCWPSAAVRCSTRRSSSPRPCCYTGDDPWDFMLDGSKVPATALPLGRVLTLPATGSEMNGGAVISRNSTQEKLAFSSPQIYPTFSILDPETTYLLAAAANGQRQSWTPSSTSWSST